MAVSVDGANNIREQCSRRIAAESSCLDIDVLVGKL